MALIDSWHIRSGSRLAWLGAFVLALTSAGCSLDDAKPRAIRAHTIDHKGVFHADPASKAERYCVRCHGDALEGGKNGEPSCLTCHGMTWTHTGFGKSLAPADHTELGEIWLHMPGRERPIGLCTTCHGRNLEGDQSSGVPGCYLCHEQLWQR